LKRRLRHNHPRPSKRHTMIIYIIVSFLYYLYILPLKKLFIFLIPYIKQNYEFSYIK
jgi:hypothetical protein